MLCFAFEKFTFFSYYFIPRLIACLFFHLCMIAHWRVFTPIMSARSRTFSLFCYFYSARLYALLVINQVQNFRKILLVCLLLFFLVSRTHCGKRPHHAALEHELEIFSNIHEGECATRGEWERRIETKKRAKRVESEWNFVWQRGKWTLTTCNIQSAMLTDYTWAIKNFSPHTAIACDATVKSARYARRVREDSGGGVRWVENEWHLELWVIKGLSLYWMTNDFKCDVYIKIHSRKILSSYLLAWMLRQRCFSWKFAGILISRQWRLRFSTE